MNDFEFKDLVGNDVNSFVKSYRDALKNQYSAENTRIDRDRTLHDTIAMGNANRSGMMFSNFPQRAKMQYEAGTYLPNKAKAFDTYQTGLQSLRKNAVGTYNNIKAMQDAIADLNKASGSSGGDPLKYLVENSKDGGKNFFNSETGNPVRFGTFFKNLGGEFNQKDISEAVGKVFGSNSDEYNRINNIFKYNPDKPIKHLSGGATQQYDRGFLSQEDEDLLNRLGFGM